MAEGLDWTGFHRIEKDLWVPAQDAMNADGETPAWQDWAPSTPQERADYGDLLLADVQELYDYVHSDAFTTALDDQGIGGISNGAIALLDEVATGKISGEEDWWSGTGPLRLRRERRGLERWRSRWCRTSPSRKGDDGEALVAQIESGYAALEESLAAHGSLTDGFVVTRS